jgi:hypothetical protein
MKIAKHSHALWLCLLIYAAWTEVTSGIAQTEAPIRTDKQEYSVVRTSNSTVRFTIKTIYTNRSQDTVYLPGCPYPSPPVLEKKVGDKWVVLYEQFEPMCRRDPLPVKPGETYPHTLDISIFPTGSNMGPQLNPGIKEIAGTYRIVRRIQRDYRASSPLLPLDERISNEFELKE